jgi:hypothetical protein
MTRARRLLGTFLSAGWLAYAVLSAVDVACPMHAIGEAAATVGLGAHAHHAHGPATAPDAGTHAHGEVPGSDHGEPDAGDAPSAPAPSCDCTSSCGLGAAHTPHVATAAYVDAYAVFERAPSWQATDVFATRTQFVLPFATAPPLT